MSKHQDQQEALNLGFNDYGEGRERERREAKRKIERAALRAAGVPNVMPEVEA